MARLADQIEEIEENLACAESRVRDLEEDAQRREDEISELEDQVAEHEAYIEWIDNTYPEARTAYDAKCRLDQAQT